MESAERDRAKDPVASGVDERDEDEPTEEQILLSLRESMKQAPAGQSRPAREALAEIRARISADAD